MLDSFNNENQEFLNLYKNIVDEVEIEEPMNWSGYEERNLLDFTYSKEEIEIITNKKTPKVCAFPFHTLAIQSDGQVVCCCVDWSRHTLVGDVTKESLYNIWHGEKLRNFRLLHLSGQRNKNEACRNCLKLPFGGAYEADNLDDVSPEILQKI